MSLAGAQVGPRLYVLPPPSLRSAFQSLMSSDLSVYNNSSVPSKLYVVKEETFKTLEGKERMAFERGKKSKNPAIPLQ